MARKRPRDVISVLSDDDFTTTSGAIDLTSDDDGDAAEEPRLERGVLAGCRHKLLGCRHASLAKAHRGDVRYGVPRTRVGSHFLREVVGHCMSGSNNESLRSHAPTVEHCVRKAGIEL